MLTGARLKPYDRLTDTEVLDNCILQRGEVWLGGNGTFNGGIGGGGGAFSGGISGSGVGSGDTLNESGGFSGSTNNENGLNNNSVHNDIWQVNERNRNDGNINTRETGEYEMRKLKGLNKINGGRGGMGGGRDGMGGGMGGVMGGEMGGISGALYPGRPPNCPGEVYDLMGSCWACEAVDRPSFDEIHRFMTLKTSKGGENKGNYGGGGKIGRKADMNGGRRNSGEINGGGMKGGRDISCGVGVNGGRNGEKVRRKKPGRLRNRYDNAKTFESGSDYDEV